MLGKLYARLKLILVISACVRGVCVCVFVCMLCMTMIALQAALGFIFAACSFIKFKIRLEKPA